MGLALGGVGGLGIGAVMFIGDEPKVVATYCSPVYDNNLDQWGLNGVYQILEGWPVLVYDDGSRSPAPVEFATYVTSRVGSKTVFADYCLVSSGT